MRNEIRKRLDALEDQQGDTSGDIWVIRMVLPKPGETAVGLRCDMLGKRLYFTNPEQGSDVAEVMHKRLQDGKPARLILMSADTTQPPTDDDYVIGPVPEGMTIEQFASDTLADLRGTDDETLSH